DPNVDATRGKMALIPASSAPLYRPGKTNVKQTANSRLLKYKNSKVIEIAFASASIRGDRKGS
ncbi:MAG: hypothetical protein VYE62_07340, partial [Pseudomonadota bacterium]|nr:hypothetical protein [Pseudomonadota bacterium]